MAVSEIHFKANASLGKMTSATVIIPEAGSGPFPVMYLLHGLSDDHTAWVRRTSIERYVQDLNLMVVMPNGDRGFYVDARARPKSAYATYICRDLVGFIDSTFRTIPERRGRVIAGLSMGGYGALTLALRYPDMFCAASSHSGALAFGSRALNRAPGVSSPFDVEFTPLVGRNPKGGRDDIYRLVRECDLSRLPSLRFDCGRKDFLIEDNREFHRFLGKRKVPHIYREYPGDHDWAYWDTHIRDTIRFFRGELEI